MRMSAFFTLPVSLMLSAWLLSIAASAAPVPGVGPSGDDGAKEAAAFLALLDEDLTLGPSLEVI